MECKEGLIRIISLSIRLITDVCLLQEMKNLQIKLAYYEGREHTVGVETDSEMTDEL